MGSTLVLCLTPPPMSMSCVAQISLKELVGVLEEQPFLYWFLNPFLYTQCCMHSGPLSYLWYSPDFQGVGHNWCCFGLRNHSTLAGLREQQVCNLVNHMQGICPLILAQQSSLFNRAIFFSSCANLDFFVSKFMNQIALEILQKSTAVIVGLCDETTYLQDSLDRSKHIVLQTMQQAQ